MHKYGIIIQSIYPYINVNKLNKCPEFDSSTYPKKGESMKKMSNFLLQKNGSIEVFTIKRKGKKCMTKIGIA